MIYILSYRFDIVFSFWSIQKSFWSIQKSFWDHFFSDYFGPFWTILDPFAPSMRYNWPENCQYNLFLKAYSINFTMTAMTRLVVKISSKNYLLFTLPKFRIYTVWTVSHPHFKMAVLGKTGQFNSKIFIGIHTYYTHFHAKKKEYSRKPIQYDWGVTRNVFVL